MSLTPPIDQATHDLRDRWLVLKVCVVLGVIPGLMFACTLGLNSQRMSSATGGVLSGLFVAILGAMCFTLYMLPGIIAGYRQHVNRAAIIALNFVGGWTVLGWIGAFVWSLTSQSRAASR